MSIINPLTSEEISNAMIKGLEDRIRCDLRARILERIEPDIENAVEAALQSFKIAIEQMRDPYNLIETVKVMIERRPR